MKNKFKQEKRRGNSKIRVGIPGVQGKSPRSQLGSKTRNNLSKL